MNEHGIAYQHGFEIWESLMRVPLILSVPGEPARRVPVKRSVIDLVPTILDVLGVARPQPGELSGQSLMADLTARAGEAPEERDVYLDMPAGPQVAQRRAIIHGATPGMKLFHLGGWQYLLFDLAHDAAEANDLARDPQELKPMIDAYQDKRASVREIYVEPDPFEAP